MTETPVVPAVPLPEGAGTAVGLIHSEPQRAVEFAGDRLADLFRAGADWLTRFEHWRGAPVDVLAATTELCDDGPAFRLILLCPESQFAESGNGPPPEYLAG
jgi:hypothetical protein